MVKYNEVCLFLQEKGYDSDEDRIGLILDLINEEYPIMDARKDIAEIVEHNG